MIKFTAKGEGIQLVGLGITEENVKRLKEGMPVKVKLRELGIDTDIEVAIFYGHDEAAIYELLEKAKLITPKTVVVPVDNGNVVN